MQNKEVKENFELITVFCDSGITHLRLNDELDNNDARLTYFRKISQICDTSTLSFSFYTDYLLTGKYWKDRFPNHIISNNNMKKLCSGYDQYIRTSFMTENFSAFESSVRVIAESYNCKKYLEFQHSINRLVSWFLDEMQLSSFYPVIRVFAHIRNSMHSNGLFNPLNQKDEEITYQNKTFSFKVGEQIEYGGWTDLFSMTKIATTTIKQIIEHPKIKEIKHIKEPSSDFW